MSMKGTMLLSALLVSAACADTYPERPSVEFTPVEPNVSESKNWGNDNKAESDSEAQGPQFTNPEEEQGLDSAAELSDFNEPCEQNNDCQSGLCVYGPQGNLVCTQSCIDECPNGWVCKEIAQRQPDLAFACSPSAAEETITPRPPSSHVSLTSGGFSGVQWGARTASIAVGVPITGLSVGANLDAELGISPIAAAD